MNDSTQEEAEVRIIDEIWQNERWQPGLGFNSLFNAASNFTDLSGEKNISCGNPPTINELPDGYEKTMIVHCFYI